jgi:hypothetical protein
MQPKKIVDALENRLGISGTPGQLRDAVEHELLTSGMGAASSAEQTDRQISKVILEITRRRDDRPERGEISILHLRGENAEVVHGSCFVFADDSKQIRQSKVNRRSVESIYGGIQCLTFNQFESFGRSVLKELGCTSPRVTPHGGDQGIDFYGEMTVGALVGADPAILKLLHQTRMILVGQAKHYPTTTISTATVRELVGALSLSRTVTYSRDGFDLLSGVNLRPFSPVMALLFSTGDFTKGARHLAKQAGLIAFSGLQLAVFLADKGVGLTEGESGVHFDAAKFDAWITK